VDKKPIDRNFEKANLSAAYTLIMPNAEDQRSLAVPDDQVLAELLNNFPDKIYNYHTHESLLDNKLEKDLTDSEKEVVIATWEKYEAEERAKAAKELSIVNNNQNESNVGLPVVEYLKSIENIAGPSK
jgi:transcriptional regulator ATRX